MARDVMSDLLGVSKKGAPPSAVIAKGAKGIPPKGAKPASKVIVKPVAGKAPLTAKGKTPPPTPAKKPPTRQAATPLDDKMKLALVEGARNYRTGGNVEKAVELIKKHKTVGEYVLAMQKSENPLPAIGLLRFLIKKGCVTAN